MRTPDYDDVDDLPRVDGERLSPGQDLPQPATRRSEALDDKTQFLFEMFVDQIEKRQARRRAN